MELRAAINITISILLIGTTCNLLSPLRAHSEVLLFQKPWADTLIGDMNFGMRARLTPRDLSKVHAPVLIRKAPTNEATAIRLHDGLIKIFYINRPGEANKMMSISSGDNGSTWNDPISEFDLPGEAYYANQVIQDKNGRIHCIFHIFRPGKMGYRGRHLDLWYTTMEPGSGWAKPRMIWEGYVGSIRGFIELKNGSLVIPMSESDTTRAAKPRAGETDFGLFQVISLYSTDHGITWTKSGNSLKIPVDADQVTRYGAVEPVAIELNDGRIWMLIRTNKGYLYESFSHDGGKSWDEAKQSSLISSDSPASFLRLSNGEIVLFLNSDQRYDDKRSYANGGREALQAALSKDETKTWMGFREVLVSPAIKPVERGDRGTAYPSAIETTNGKILFISGQGEEGAVVVFNKKWLEEKKQKDDKKEGPVYWTMHGNKAGAGVWNFPMTKKGNLTINIKPKLPTGPIEIALTDHFSAAHDSIASKLAPFSFYLTQYDIQKNILKVKIQWDIDNKEVVVYRNGEKIPGNKLQFRTVERGFNYLRVLVKGQAESIYKICSVTMTSK